MGIHWEEILDPETGTTFYMNHSTGETEWERPEGVEIMSSRGSDSDLQEEMSPEENSRDVHAVQAPLGTDWLEVKDPETGRAYFFNIRTQVNRCTSQIVAHPQVRRRTGKL